MSGVCYPDSIIQTAVFIVTLHSTNCIEGGKVQIEMILEKKNLDIQAYQFMSNL